MSRTGDLLAEDAPQLDADETNQERLTAVLTPQRTGGSKSARRINHLLALRSTTCKVILLQRHRLHTTGTLRRQWTPRRHLRTTWMNGRPYRDRTDGTRKLCTPKRTPRDS